MILLGEDDGLVPNPQKLPSHPFMELPRLYALPEPLQLSGLTLCSRTAELPKTALGSTIDITRGMILPGGGDTPVSNPQKLPCVKLQKFRVPPVKRTPLYEMFVHVPTGMYQEPKVFER